MNYWPRTVPGTNGTARIATIVSTLEGTDTYSYDQTSQLVGATHTSHANETYGFDANGNRNTTGFTTGDNNQTTAGLGFTYTFDDEGNRTKRTETATGKVQEYDWDHRNRLIAVKDKNTSAGAIVRQVNYQYDAFNRLVRRDHDADGAGAGAATSQFWIYDEGINAVLQFDGSSASNLSHRYLWTKQVDDLVADEQVTSLSTGGNTLWGLVDHLGSIRDIADQNESTGVTTIANHRRNNSFGQLISETNASVDMIFAFTGKQYDEATGLQHNLNRWYDPALGQWLNEDPIGFSAGDENVRRYVGNGVTGAVDPSGLQEPTKKGILDDVQRLPDIHKTGPSIGTPVKPTGKGLAINIYGSEENPIYKDYAADAQFDEYDKEGERKRRLHTSDLEPNTVSDICIRNSPVFPIFWQEVIRIKMDHATVTIAGDRNYVMPIYRDLNQGRLIENWRRVSHPQTIPQIGRNGEEVRGAELTVFTLQLNEDSTYVGPTDPSKEASSPERK